LAHESLFGRLFNRRTDDDLRYHYNRVQKIYTASAFGRENATIDIAKEIIKQFRVPYGFDEPFIKAITDLILAEDTFFYFPDEPDWRTLQPSEAQQLTQALKACESVCQKADVLRPLLINTFGEVLSTIEMRYPRTAPSPFSAPLLDIIDVRFLILVIKSIFDSADQEGFHSETGYTITRLYREDAPNPTTCISPTPLYSLLKQTVQLPYTYEERFSHTHIIGGNKAGKTTLLKRLILYDLQQDIPPALVIVDSQNDLVDYVARLDLPRLKDKLVVISPRENVSINIFAFDEARYRGYSGLEREQVATAAVKTLDFLFEGLGIDLTGKQGILFEYSARIMLLFPEAMGRNAMLGDFIDLLSQPEPAWLPRVVARASNAQRSFFERDFKDKKEFGETKSQLRYRLQGIQQTPTLERLFASEENRIDFYTLLNSGAVILIDTAKDLLRDDAKLYGRVFISRIIQAAFERAIIPQEKREPAFLFVDEAHEYFDTNTKEMLTDLRKFKLGCVFAHHGLEECGASLRAALATEPAIRMASRVSVDDAKTLASWMRTNADTILNQPRHHFATYIQDVTPSAVSVSVSIDEVNKQPRLSEKAYEEMRRRNRDRVSAGQQQRQRQHQPPPPPPPQQEPPPRQEAPGLGSPFIDLEQDDDGTYRL